MALLAVTSWTANKVQDWLSGLDESVQQHIEKFALYNVTGRKLLLLSPHDLRTMIDTIGQQELILDAIQQLASVFYGTESETIVSLAFELRSQSKSLANQLRAGIAKRIGLQNATGGQVCENVTIETQIGTQTLLLLQTARTLLDWFGGPLPASYSELESFRQKLLCETVDLSERSYSCLRRCGAPRQLLEAIRDAAMRIESLCDSYVKNCRDPVAITPCLLEIVTLKLKPADELGIHLHTSPIGAHVIASIAPGSAAAQCGKLCESDEVIQVNSVTVIGWQHRKVIQLFERESESGKTDMLLMIRRRPFALPEYGRLRHAHTQPCNANSSAVTNSASSNANNTLIRASSRPKAKQSIRKNESAATYLPEPGCTGQPGNCNSVELERSDAARGDELQANELKANGVPKTSEAAQSELNPDVDLDRELLRQAALHQLGGLTQQDSVRYRDRRNTFSIPRRSTANSMTTSQPTDTKLERDSTLKANSGEKNSEQTSQSAGASTQQLNEPASFPENTTGVQQPPAAVDAVQSLNVPCSTVHHHRYHSAEALLSDASASQNDQSTARAAKELTSSTTASSNASLATGIYGMTAPRAGVKRSNAPAQPTASHDETPNRAPTAIVAARREQTTTTTATVTGHSKGQPMTNKDTISVTTVRQNMFSYKSKDALSSTQQPTGTPTHSQQRPELSANATAVTTANDAKTNTVSSPSSGAPIPATSRRIDRRVSCKDLGKGDFEGWLWRKRRPGRLPKAGWVKRWCVLKHACLYYYKTHEDQRAEGVLQLHGVIIRPDDCGAEKRTGPARHRFTIENPQIEFKLAAETDLDRNEWLRRLQLISIRVNPRTVAVSQPTQPSTPQHQPAITARSISQPAGAAPSGSCSSSETTVSALSTPNTSAANIAASLLSLEGYYSGSSDDDDVVLLEQRESFIDNTYHPPDCKHCK